MMAVVDLRSLGKLIDGKAAHELAETKLTTLDRDVQKFKAALSKRTPNHEKALGA